ncbi:MAG TPA: copper resistance protein CopC [Chloroflexota bacterium]|nr:copper resistance protein CopC [Chloroflexota bacterium]
MLAALWPASALAHASFVRSDPPDLCGPLAQPRVATNDPRCQTGVVLDQAPGSVRITFSEPVQLAGRGIRVLSPSGKPVQQGKALVEGEQATVHVQADGQGTYIVDWQVLSADTHPARGRFAFSVGQPSALAGTGVSDVGQVAPLGLALQTLARWLHFAGYALAFGTLGVALLTRSFAGGAQWRLTNAGVVLLLLAEPLALVGQTASLGVDQALDGDALTDALASPFGRLLAFRLAAALLLWVASGSLQGGPDDVRPNRKLSVGIAVGLGATLAAIDGLGQHAASFQPQGLGLAVHGLHLMAMAVWLGGVVLFAVERERRSGIGKIVGVALAVVAVTGLAMALVHIRQPDDVIATVYGQVLAGKQVLLLAAAVLGWLALRRPKWRPWLGELSALVLLIGLAGLLVSLPPPR